MRMNNPMKIKHLFLLLCPLIFATLLHCGGAETLDRGGSANVPDGSAFMTLTASDATHALITVDMRHSSLASYLTTCLDLEVSGSDSQNPDPSARSTATVTIWDSNTFGAVALDLDGGTYTGDPTDQIAEVVVGSDIFDLSQAITVQLVTNDCSATGTAIFEIVGTLE